MATCLVYGNDIGYTIMPYTFDKPLEEELLAYPHDSVLGFVTQNKETGERKFTYTESGKLTDATDHWSLTVLKGFPYLEHDGPWIVYSCEPEDVRIAFGKILSQYAQSLHIYNWDVWAVSEKNAKVAVVTSWESY